MQSHTKDSEIFFTFTDPTLVNFPGGAHNNWDADENQRSDWMKAAPWRVCGPCDIPWTSGNGTEYQQTGLQYRRVTGQRTNLSSSTVSVGGEPGWRKASVPCAVTGYTRLPALLSLHSVVKAKLCLANFPHLGT